MTGSVSESEPANNVRIRHWLGLCVLLWFQTSKIRQMAAAVETSHFNNGEAGNLTVLSLVEDVGVLLESNACFLSFIAQVEGQILFQSGC
jgi:hypothetical protein